MKFLQYFNPFRKPSADELARELIDEAERLALLHHAEAEQLVAAAEGMSAKGDMYEARADRLRAALLTKGGV
ncbi:hypothetical protein [Acidovorax phage ACPWH]|nr:hypothetical protein [Acidovorax phage ACPWH]QXV72221.1 hypothetical protein Acf1_00024 [Acidovorax phage ACF1]